MKTLKDVIDYITEATGKEPKTFDELNDMVREYLLQILEEKNECELPGIFKVKKYGDVLKVEIDGKITTMNIYGELLS